MGPKEEASAITASPSVRVPALPALYLSPHALLDAVIATAVVPALVSAAAVAPFVPPLHSLRAAHSAVRDVQVLAVAITRDAHYARTVRVVKEAGGSRLTLGDALGKPLESVKLEELQKLPDAGILSESYPEISHVTAPITAVLRGVKNVASSAYVRCVAQHNAQPLMVRRARRWLCLGAPTVPTTSNFDAAAKKQTDGAGMASEDDGAPSSDSGSPFKLDQGVINAFATLTSMVSFRFIVPVLDEQDYDQIIGCLCGVELRPPLSSRDEFERRCDSEADGSIPFVAQYKTNGRFTLHAGDTARRIIAASEKHLSSFSEDGRKQGALDLWEAIYDIEHGDDDGDDDDDDDDDGDDSQCAPMPVENIISELFGETNTRRFGVLRDLSTTFKFKLPMKETGAAPPDGNATEMLRVWASIVLNADCVRDLWSDVACIGVTEDLSPSLMSTRPCNELFPVGAKCAGSDVDDNSIATADVTTGDMDADADDHDEDGVTKKGKPTPFVSGISASSVSMEWAIPGSQHQSCWSVPGGDDSRTSQGSNSAPSSKLESNGVVAVSQSELQQWFTAARSAVLTSVVEDDDMGRQRCAELAAVIEQFFVEAFAAEGLPCDLSIHQRRTAHSECRDLQADTKLQTDTERHHSAVVDSLDIPTHGNRRINECRHHHSVRPAFDGSALAANAALCLVLRALPNESAEAECAAAIAHRPMMSVRRDLYVLLTQWAATYKTALDEGRMAAYVSDELGAADDQRPSDDARDAVDDREGAPVDEPAAKPTRREAIDLGPVQKTESQQTLDLGKTSVSALRLLRGTTADSENVVLARKRAATFLANFESAAASMLNAKLATTNSQSDDGPQSTSHTQGGEQEGNQTAGLSFGERKPWTPINLNSIPQRVALLLAVFDFTIATAWVTEDTRGANGSLCFTHKVLVGVTREMFKFSSYYFTNCGEAQSGSFLKVEPADDFVHQFEQTIATQQNSLREVNDDNRERALEKEGLDGESNTQGDEDPTTSPQKTRNIAAPCVMLKRDCIPAPKKRSFRESLTTQRRTQFFTNTRCQFGGDAGSSSSSSSSLLNVLLGPTAVVVASSSSSPTVEEQQERVNQGLSLRCPLLLRSVWGGCLMTALTAPAALDSSRGKGICSDSAETQLDMGLVAHTISLL